jgi:Photosynthesis system II assembly factor YCF48
MGHDERERKFEQALQRHLRRDAAGARNEADAQAVPDEAVGAVECLDAGTLAAFHEGTLSSSEIVAVKEHVADCSRCQEILSQLEATDEIPLPVEPGKDLKMRESVLPTGALYVDYAARQTPSLTVAGQPTPAFKAPHDISRGRGFKALRWAAPAGAIAAGLLIWIVVRDHKVQNTHFENVQIAQEQPREKRVAPQALSTSPIPPAPAPGSKALNGPRKDEAMTRQLAGEPGAVRAQERYSPNVKAKSANRVAASSNPTTSAPASGCPTDVPMGSRQCDHLVVLAPSAKQGPQSPVTSPTDLSASSAAGVLPAPAASTGASANAADKKADADSARTTLTIIDEGYSLPTEQIATADKLREPTFETSGKTALAKTVLAHGGTVLWRLGARGQIVRSVDGGVTWVLQNSGVKVELLAGSAPSEAVCWVVGRNGSILRTTDGGGHWNKVVSPIRGDIARVQAADAMTAAIFDANKSSRFVTHDGGVTWQAAKE